jgi:pimeloyl-ACP methyl ester carboxylesterase
MSLSYERRGAGEPVLLIHGLGGSLGQWRPVVELLALIASEEIFSSQFPRIEPEIGLSVRHES